MASPPINKTSWLREKLTRRTSGQSKQVVVEQDEEDFEFVGENIVTKATHDLEGGWEVLTLAKQKNMNRTTLDANHTDGVLLQGGNKSGRKISGNNKLMSPILGGRSGGIRSALKHDKKSIGDMADTRPASAGANIHRSTSNKKKLLTADGYPQNSRTPSPGMERNTSTRSSFKRKGVVTPVKESSPSDIDHSPSIGGNFSKIRDTLRIRKGKKKSTKVAQYSVPELNFPMKYEDPFDVYADFGETPDISGSSGHNFVSVDVPHHKPEYCDHCQQATMGHNQTLKCTSKSIVLFRSLLLRTVHYTACT